MPRAGDILPGILPIGLSLLAGAPGAGKTTLIAWIAAQLRDNAPIFGHQPNLVPFVGALVTDRSWDSHEQWFEAAGFPDIPHYSYQDDYSLAWDRFNLRTELAGLFIEGLTKLAPGGLPAGSVVFVDTASMFVDGNLNDYKRAGISLGHLNRICRRRSICAIGTMHMSKQKSDMKDRYLRPQDRILGSAALLGFTDTAMFILTPEETSEDHHLFGWVPHHSPPESFQLTRIPASGLFALKGSEADANELRLATLLALIDPLPTGSVASDVLQVAAPQLKLSRSQLYRLLKTLTSRGAISPGPVHGRFYRILPA